MKNSFNSIQTKITILTLLGILFAIGVMGSFGLYYTTGATDKNTASTMNAACHQEAAKLNNLFLRIEQSVNIMAYKALDRYNIKEMLQDKEQNEHYLEEMETILKGTLGSTEGAVATFLRFEPQLASSNTNLYLVKDKKEKGETAREEEKYVKHYIGSMSSLEWYDSVVETGQAVWLEPYDSSKVNDTVISYSTPLFQDGELVGVVGMHILFEDIIEEINSVKLYESGYGYMINDKKEIIYHPKGEDSFSISRKHEEWDAFVAMLDNKQEKDFIFEYGYNGEDKKMTYSKLENGMLLIVTAPADETDLEKNQLITTLLIATVLVSLICCYSVVMYAKTIIRPLKELTKAAKEVAQGNMNVTLVNNSTDEVGELAVSFQQTVECLKVYMDQMRDLAYRDPLTGVRSKTAYDEEVKKITNNLENGFRQFGVLMLDINGLKGVNDQYGHEVGNAYIINCCKLICMVFKHSPVFRIGGDEFIALLMGEDLLNVDRLLERFYVRMDQLREKATCPEEMVSVAAGYAVFEEESDSGYEDVFVRADETMYKKKASMKQAGSEIR